MNPRHFLIEGIIGKEINVDALRYADFLRRVVDLVAMKAISDAKVVCHQDGQIWSGIIILAESHISFHINKGWVFVDVFSCKWFDATPVVEYVRRFFGIDPGSFQHRSLRRGWELEATPNVV